jgi:ABC-type transporter Mla subunit MlaD
MTVGLRAIIALLTESANAVSSAATQLTAVAEQSSEATSQIALTIQQVANGTAQQSQSINRTAASVEQMGRAIDGIAGGAQEQANPRNQPSWRPTAAFSRGRRYPRTSPLETGILIVVDFLNPQIHDERRRAELTE